MNRIDNKFKQLKARKKKAFIAYVTAGDPDLSTTEKLVLSFAQSGVDLIELGVPFSDPMADGRTIQAGSQRALESKTTLPKILKLVERLRRKTEIPILFMTYYNPVYHYGEASFIRDAKKVGVDGLIFPDLPPEEGKNLRRLAQAAGISMVFLFAPTTLKERLKLIANASSGFLYYVSLTGVTGERKNLSASLFQNVRSAKRLTAKPVCVGFGISTPEQARAVAKVADGIIIGSAIVKQIEKNLGKSKLVANVTGFVKKLANAVK
jgi:tryptophan synthase alpha chain